MAERGPVFIGGQSAIYSKIASSLNYPPLARENTIQGRVLILFTIDENGNVSDFKVMSGIGWGCDKAALEVVKNLPHNWVPAMKDGKPIRTQRIMPIRFVLG